MEHVTVGRITQLTDQLRSNYDQAMQSYGTLKMGAVKKTMDKPQNPQIENNFVYHAPKEGQPEIYAAIREKAKELAYLIDEKVPNSREKSLAITQLEQAVFWANAGVARN